MTTKQIVYATKNIVTKRVFLIRIKIGVAENKVERKMIKTLKKGSRIMITGYNKSGSQTIDHYSLLGFTKAYNSAKKNCS